MGGGRLWNLFWATSIQFAYQNAILQDSFQYYMPFYENDRLN